MLFPKQPIFDRRCRLEQRAGGITIGLALIMRHLVAGMKTMLSATNRAVSLPSYSAKEISYPARGKKRLVSHAAHIAVSVPKSALLSFVKTWRENFFVSMRNENFLAPRFSERSPGKILVRKYPKARL